MKSWDDVSLQLFAEYETESIGVLLEDDKEDVAGIELVEEF